MEKLKKLLTRSLLAFALVSIGFAFGKHSIKPAQPEVEPSSGEGRHVAVYYLHSTFRCEMAAPYLFLRISPACLMFMHCPLTDSQHAH